jgi:hypothetical protein
MAQNSTATAYKIYKNQTFVGYLIGSMHHNFNPQDYENIKIKLEPLIKECSTVFLECNLPQSTAMPYGYEKAVLEILERDFKTYIYFESIFVQKALLQGSFWLGTKIRHFPWHNYTLLQKAPYFFQLLSQTMLTFILIYNKIYNRFSGGAHGIAVTEHQKKEQQAALVTFQNYMNNIATPFYKLNSKMFLMPERNKLYVEKIIEQQGKNTPLFIMVGVAHLPSTLQTNEAANHKDGMVDLLEAADYQIEAIKI